MNGKGAAALGLLMFSQAIATCIGSPSSPSLQSILEQVSALTVREGDTATYQSSFGTVNWSVGPVREMPGGLGAAAEVELVRTTSGTTVRQWYYIDQATGRLTAKVERSEDNGVTVTEILRPTRSTALHELPLVGFQVVAAPVSESLHIGDRTMPISDQAARLINEAETNTYHPPSIAPVGGIDRYTLEFDTASYFPLLVEGSFLGTLKRLAFQPGEGQTILPSNVGQDRSTVAPGAALVWDSPTPPESTPSAIRFPLREAYGELLARSDGAKAYSGEFPKHWVCRGLYHEVNPLVPPGLQTWRLTLCDLSGNAYEAVVDRQDAAVPLYNVYGEVRREANNAMPRELLPPRLVPVDGVYAAQIPPSRDSDNGSDFVFSASDWDSTIVVYADGPQYVDSMVRLEIIAYEGPQYHFLASDGTLYRIIEGLNIG